MENTIVNISTKWYCSSVYLVCCDERLDRRRRGSSGSRELYGRDWSSGEKSNRRNGRAQVPVAESRWTVVSHQPVFGSVHRPFIQHRQYRPSDRAHPVRICGRDACRTTTSVPSWSVRRITHAQLCLWIKSKNRLFTAYNSKSKWSSWKTTESGSGAPDGCDELPAERFVHDHRPFCNRGGPVDRFATSVCREGILRKPWVIMNSTLSFHCVPSCDAIKTRRVWRREGL